MNKFLKKFSTLTTAVALASGFISAGTAPAVASAKPELMLVKGDTMAQCKTQLSLTLAGLSGAREYPYIDIPCRFTTGGLPDTDNYTAVVGYYPR